MQPPLLAEPDLPSRRFAGTAYLRMLHGAAAQLLLIRTLGVRRVLERRFRYSLQVCNGSRFCNNKARSGCASWCHCVFSVALTSWLL